MKAIPTSPTVWVAILSKHSDDLVVFSSYSAPEGDQLGNPDQGVMDTTYGFRGADCPLMRARSTWDIDRSKPFGRRNEKHEYWLCVAEKELD